MTEIEKQSIERSTAEGFLLIYNHQHGTDYRIEKVAGPGESPDVRCIDSRNDALLLEITLIEDNKDGIQAALGRSGHKSFNATRELLRKVREGKAEMPINRLDGNVSEILIKRLRQKYRMRYGKNVALVVRETSLAWDWDLVLPKIQDEFRNGPVPFDRGVWLLSRSRERLIRVF